MVTKREGLWGWVKKKKQKEEQYLEVLIKCDFSILHIQKVHIFIRMFYFES